MIFMILNYLYPHHFINTQSDWSRRVKASASNHWFQYIHKCILTKYIYYLNIYFVNIYLLINIYFKKVRYLAFKEKYP